MSTKENNRTNKIPAKTHNPKAHAPAVYIPCWLIQIASSQLSHQAKLLYGRLAQWSSAKGTVHRSTNQLSQELGMQQRVIERGLKELREVKLIETYQTECGGINHYRFLEHDWMNEPINKNLEYNSPHYPPDKNVGTPPTNVSVPTDKNVGAKIKKIKRNKKTTTTLARETAKKSSSSGFVINQETDKKLLELRNKYLQADELDRTDEEFLKQCSHHLDNGDKNKYNLTRRVKGLETIIKSGFFEKPAGYDEKKIVKSTFTPEENVLIQTYGHALKMEKLGMKIQDFIPDPQELKKAMELMGKAQQNKPSFTKRIGQAIGFN